MFQEYCTQTSPGPSSGKKEHFVFNFSKVLFGRGSFSPCQVFPLSRQGWKKWGTSGLFFFLFGVHIAVAITSGLRAHRCVQGSNIHVPKGPRLINARGNFHNWRQTQRRESYSPHTKQRLIGQLFIWFEWCLKGKRENNWQNVPLRNFSDRWSRQILD